MAPARAPVVGAAAVIHVVWASRARARRIGVIRTWLHAVTELVLSTAVLSALGEVVLAVGLLGVRWVRGKASKVDAVGSRDGVGCSVHLNGAYSYSSTWQAGPQMPKQVSICICLLGDIHSGPWRSMLDMGKSTTSTIWPLTSAKIGRPSLSTGPLLQAEIPRTKCQPGVKVFSKLCLTQNVLPFRRSG